MAAIGLLLLAGCLSYAQDMSGGLTEAILYITGRDSVEDLTEDELEYYVNLSDNPLRLNNMSSSRLRSCGLFSKYQVATMEDYISRSGAIASFSELSAIDGFGHEFAQALKYFLILDVSSNNLADYAGKKCYGHLTSSISGKYTKPNDEAVDDVYSWKLKSTIEYPGRISVGLSARKQFTDPNMLPSAVSGYALFTGRSRLNSLIIGDYSVRMGQGLALWSGYQMGGVSGERSFYKRPSGLSPSLSMSSDASMRGIATGFSFGGFDLTAFVSVPGLREMMSPGNVKNKKLLSLAAGLSVGWNWRNGALSVNGLYDIEKISKVSADLRICKAGTDIAAELAWDIFNKKPAASAVVVSPLSENLKLALNGRYLPDGYNLSYSSPIRMFSGKKGEMGVSAGLFFKDFRLVADYASRTGQRLDQLKIHLTGPVKFSKVFSNDLKASIRWRSQGIPSRYELRSDFKYLPGRWNTVLRLNCVKGDGWGFLGYLEEGYDNECFAFYLRGTAFHVKHWEDRIYVYERDAPGNFNVPAYCGLGWSSSITGRYKFSMPKCRVTIYLRVGYLHYLKMEKPTKIDFRFQAAMNF